LNRPWKRSNPGVDGGRAQAGHGDQALELVVPSGLCRDVHWFASLQPARETIDTWREHYKHRQIVHWGKKALAVFAQKVRHCHNLRIAA